jgi:two-component system LytT family response regulator
MKAMLALYAPEINILGEADSVKTGTKLIEGINPDIVFLDIMMNDGSA